MTDSFERWINSMSDIEYEDWLEDDATEAQEDVALNIRQPLAEDELEDMEREQEFTPQGRIEQAIEEAFPEETRKQSRVKSFFKRLFRL